jgi:hypothetical protein
MTGKDDYVRIVASMLVALLLQSQPTPVPDVLLRFKNGTEVRARLVEIKGDTYTVDLVDGRRMSYPASDVEAMQRLDDPAASPVPPSPAPAITPAPELSSRPDPAIKEPCKVFVTEEKVPIGYFTAVKHVKWNKKYYGSSDGAYEKLAIEAVKLGADAVVQVEISHRPSGFAWSTPHVDGLAVKWTDEGRANFGTLKGECVTVAREKQEKE